MWHAAACNHYAAPFPVLSAHKCCRQGVNSGSDGGASRSPSLQAKVQQVRMFGPRSLARLSCSPQSFGRRQRPRSASTTTRLLHPAGCATVLLRGCCGIEHLARCATSRRHHDGAAAVPGSVAGSGSSVCGQELQRAELVSSKQGRWCHCGLCLKDGVNWVPGCQPPPLKGAQLAQPCPSSLHALLLWIVQLFRCCTAKRQLCCWAQGSCCVMLGALQTGYSRVPAYMLP